MARPKLVPPPFAVAHDVKGLAEAKLNESGLSLQDAEALGIVWLTADETKARDESLWYQPSLEFTYHDPWSDKPLVARPNWPETKRYRCLADVSLLPKDFPKYLQPKGSAVGAYFPRGVDWPTVLADYTTPISITEGELKSAKACKDGFITIGLGGVYSFMAMNQGFSFLPELEKIVWARREVFIIFDSDARHNENVNNAMWRLAEELQHRGAMPKAVILPSNGEKKVGLDDLLVAHGPDSLSQLMLTADHLTIADVLWRLNERYAYVENSGFVVRRATGDPMRPEALKTHAETAAYMENKLLPNGAVSRQRVKAGEAWLSWPLRTTVSKLAYLPGKTPRSVVEHEGGLVYNMWSGWACEPKKGDASRFVKLVNHLFTGVPPEEKKWFLQWLAYPIQHPGTKLLTSVVIWSIMQGVGKTLLGVTLQKVYGDNYTTITQELLSGSFNEWAKCRQLIVGDDVTSSEKRRDLDRLKTLITATHTRINEKHVPAYVVEDRANFLWTSNHADAFFLEQNDRRFYIHEVLVGPMDLSFYDDYSAWLDSGEAGPAVFHYLLNVDLPGFNPNARAMATAAKENMIRLAKTDVDGWISDMLAYPDDHLRIGEAPIACDMLTLRQLRSAYETSLGVPMDMSHIGFARKLAAQGVHLVNGGAPLYVPGTDLARYYIVRHREKWAKAPLDAVRKHIGGYFASMRMRV